MRAVTTLVALAMAVVCLARPSLARAGDEVVTGPASDPLPITSLITAGAGALTLGSGVALLATAPAERRCGGLGGCLPSSSEGPQRDAGALLTGGGAGLLGVGTLGWLLTDGGPLRTDERRDAPAAASAGLATVGLGVGAIGAGLSLGAAATDRIEASRAAPWLIAGGGLLAVGIPMTLVAAAREDPEEREGERIDDERARRAAVARAEARGSWARARTRHDEEVAQRLEHGELERQVRHPALIATGVVVLVLGVGVAGGCALAAAEHEGEGLSHLGHELGYAAGAALGGVVAIGGGVMIAVGAQSDVVETGRGGRSLLVPREVKVGPTTASATWSF